MKNVLIGLLALVVVVLLAMGVRQEDKIRELRVQVDKVEKAVAKAAAVQHEAGFARSDAIRPSSVDTPIDELLAGERGKASSQAGVPASISGSSEPEAEAGSDDEDSSGDENPLAGITKMMKNPAMRELMRAQAKGMVDQTYGPLLTSLSLSTNDLEEFKQLLTDKQIATMEASLDLMDGDFAANITNSTSATKIMELTEEYKEKIKDLLGDEDFSIYEQYELTQPERMEVSMFKQTLGVDEALDVDQEHKLILAMYETRTNYPALMAQNSDMPDADMFTAQGISNQMAELTLAQEQYAAKASEILSPEQMEKFKSNQANMRQMTELGLKMAEQMFGQPGADK